MFRSLPFLLPVVVGCVSDHVTAPAASEDGQTSVDHTLPPAANCTVTVTPDVSRMRSGPGGTVLFRVMPSGRISPERTAVTASVRCRESPAAASLAVTLAGEVAEWEAMECEARETVQACGEIVPLTHGRTMLTATFAAPGKPPFAADSVPVVMNRTPRRKNRCEPGNHSQLCRLVSLEFAVGERVQLDLNDYMEDADHDSLTYAVDALNGHSLLRIAEVTIAGSLMSLTGIAEGNGRFTISVNDGWEDFGWGLGPVQVGCPGLSSWAGEGTGRIKLFPVGTLPRLSACDVQVLDAAVAYWERVLAGDDRTVVVTLSDAGDDRLSSAWGTGTGPTDQPGGAVAFGRDLGLVTRPARFYNIARHELAHALGIGSGREWWTRLRNRFDGDRDNPPDTHFVGERAYRAFREMGGGDFYESEGVPVANGRVPSRVQPNTHWQQHVIDTELMVDCRDHLPEDPPCPDVMPVSPITLAALADMGWIVDMSLAEPGARIGDWRYQ